MDINDIVDGCVNAMKAKMKNLNTLNVVVVGKTGVGKSTLVNAIFRENLAATGIGSPVTQKMTRYTKKDMPLAIYDTKGFELGREAQKEVKDELLSLIRQGVESRDINKAIHCIWYCVNAHSSRLEPEEEEWLRSLAEGNSIYQVPVIIVITRSDNKSEAQQLKKLIETKNLDVKKVITVLAQDEVDGDRCKEKAYGTDTLVEIMQEVLPDELLDTLMSVQQANLSLKKKKAQAAVVAAAASAAAAGASPIPFSDAVILMPIEVTMMTSITVIFGFEFSKSVLTNLVSAIIGTGGSTVAGRTMVSNLLKIIPGVGSIAGGVISGGTAAVLTTALGEAYIGVMTAMYNGELKAKDLETKAGQNHLGKLFKEQLQKNK